MSPLSPAAIHTAVRERYRPLAGSAAGAFPYPTGAEGARRLGYPPALLATAPAGLLAAFCGVGNPLALGEVPAGAAVLDVGCGAGLDLLHAHQLTGPAGPVTGVDLTPEMVAAARRHLAGTGVQVLEGTAEHLPVADASFDLAISNGALNLATDKAQAFRELHRVLRPGGRVQMADIVRAQDLPDELTGSLEAWSG
jgi:SAM-dependent methyltransferase